MDYENNAALFTDAFLLGGTIKKSSKTNVSRDLKYLKSSLEPGNINEHGLINIAFDIKYQSIF